MAPRVTEPTRSTPSLASLPQAAYASQQDFEPYTVSRRPRSRNASRVHTQAALRASTDCTQSHTVKILRTSTVLAGPPPFPTILLLCLHPFPTILLPILLCLPYVTWTPGASAGGAGPPSRLLILLPHPACLLTDCHLPDALYRVLEHCTCPKLSGPQELMQAGLGLYLLKAPRPLVAFSNGQLDDVLDALAHQDMWRLQRLLWQQVLACMPKWDNLQVRGERPAGLRERGEGKARRRADAGHGLPSAFAVSCPRLLDYCREFREAQEICPAGYSLP